MTKYSTVSARLDLELLTSTQRMREAFSNDEFRGAKRKNEELEKYQEVQYIVVVCTSFDVLGSKFVFLSSL